MMNNSRFIKNLFCSINLHDWRAASYQGGKLCGRCQNCETHRKLKGFDYWFAITIVKKLDGIWK